MFSPEEQESIYGREGESQGKQEKFGARWRTLAVRCGKNPKLIEHTMGTEVAEAAPNAKEAV